MTHAFIFDLDGTLVDTAPDLLEALNFVLEREGRRRVDHADLRHLVGHGSRQMLEEAFRMTGGALPEDRLPALIDDYIAHYGRHIAVGSRPFPGVEETLRRLVRADARLGVLTNKPQDLAEKLLIALGLERFFAAIFGAGRMGYVKPDARIFHDVVEAVGGPGAGAIMVGDSATDLATARAAQVPVILVSFGYTPVPVRELGADAVVDDFTDIPSAARRLLGPA